MSFTRTAEENKSLQSNVAINIDIPYDRLSGADREQFLHRVLYPQIINPAPCTEEIPQHYQMPDTIDRLETGAYRVHVTSMSMLAMRMRWGAFDSKNLYGD